MSDPRLDIQFGAQTAPLEAGVAKAQSVVEAGAAAIIAAIQAMSAQVTAAIEAMSAALANKPRAAADAAQAAIQQMAKWREQLLEQKAASDGNRREELATEVEFWRQRLALAQGDSKLEIQVATELARARVALSRLEIADAHQADELKLQGAREHSLAAIDLAEARVREEARLGHITTQQELAQLTALDAQKRDIAIAVAEEEFALSDKGAAAEQRAANAKMKAWDDFHAHVEAIADQIAKGQQKSAEQAARAWENAFRPVDSAFNTVVRGVMSGHETLRQALAKGAQSFVTSELEADAKVLFNKLALFAATKAGFISTDAAELASKHQATGGIITSLLFRRTTEQTATQATVATHAIGENAKTLATVAGNAERTTSNVTAAAVTRAADTAETKSSVGKHAASAAAAVYDDVSQIPYVGWILAPIAATAAYAAVMAYDSLIPSFAEGGVMPADGLAQLHKNEMVLPANVSTKLQSMFSIGETMLAAGNVGEMMFGALMVQGSGNRGWGLPSTMGGALSAGGSFPPGTSGAVVAPTARTVGGDTHVHVTVNAMSDGKMSGEEIAVLIANSARNGTIQRALQQARASL